MQDRLWGRIANGLVIIFIGFVISYHIRQLNHIPLEYHSWTQCDYLAVAKKFSNESLDFFHPQTYCLNKFSDEVGNPSPTGNITRIDFPIHSWIAGILMKMTGNQTPFYYRLLVLLVNLVGLFYLWKLFRSFLLNYTLSVLMFLLCLMSPVYFYYMSGTFATPFGIGFIFIAYYFYFDFRNNKIDKSIYKSVLFFTLAALVRTQMSLFLIATFCHLILDLFTGNKRTLKIFLVYIISFIVVGGYGLYNYYLQQIYGSMFLSKLMNARSFSEFGDILKYIYEKNLLQYYTAIQLIGVLLSLIAFPLYMRFRKDKRLLDVYIQAIISGFGALLIFLLLQRQFIVHDYYFIDIFLAPSILALLCLIPVLGYTGRWIKAQGVYLFVIVVCISSFILFFNTNRERSKITEWQTSYHYANKAKYINSIFTDLGVQHNDSILTIFPPSPNLPLLLTDRNGYFILDSRTERYKHTLDKNYSVALLEYSQLQNAVKKLSLFNYLHVEKWNKGLLYLGKNKEKKENSSIYEFLKRVIDVKISSKLDIDNTPEDWHITKHYDSTKFDRKVYALEDYFMYGSTYKRMINTSNLTSHVLFRTRIATESADELPLVFQLKGEGIEDFYAINKIEVKKNSGFQDVFYIIDLPEFEKNKEVELKLFFWIPDKSKVYYEGCRVDFFNVLLH
ncbi:MAG: glycosyltransferase family 39 protein [Hyphomicrobiales bacterium]